MKMSVSNRLSFISAALIIFAALFSVVLSGCATQMAAIEITGNPTDKYDNVIQAVQTNIKNSTASDQDKSNTTSNVAGFVKEYYPVWDELFSYHDQLKDNLLTNTKKDSSWTLWNAIGVGLGSFTSLTALAAPIGVGAPIVVGVYGIVEGAVQSNNLQPYIKDVSAEIVNMETEVASVNDLKTNLWVILVTSAPDTIVPNLKTWLAKAALQANTTEDNLSKSKFFRLKPSESRAMFRSNFIRLQP